MKSILFLPSQILSLTLAYRCIANIKIILSTYTKALHIIRVRSLAVHAGNEKVLNSDLHAKNSTAAAQSLEIWNMIPQDIQFNKSATPTFEKLTLVAVKKNLISFSQLFL